MKAKTKTQKKTNQLTSIQRKKQVNLPWNATRNFQLGLILSLAGVILIVASVRVKIINQPERQTNRVPDELFVLNNFIIEEAIAVNKPKPVVKQKEVIVKDVIKIIDNLPTVKSTPSLLTSKPLIQVDPGISLASATSNSSMDSAPVLLNTVSQVPLFPGCIVTADRQAQIACFTQLVHRYISSRFFADDYAGEFGPGKHRIYCQFVIDKFGEVQNVQVRTTVSQAAQEVKK